MTSQRRAAAPSDSSALASTFPPKSSNLKTGPSLGSFDTERPTQPRFGVNYTPRRGWFHSWLDFDVQEVKEDFAMLASLGIDHVRVFPLWPLLQPNRTLIRPQALADVRAVVDAAGEAGLDAVVDVLQGHMSSFDFLPSWVTTWHRRNKFTHPEVLEGTAELVRALGARLADAPNLIGLSTGNETNQFTFSEHPDPDSVSVQEAEQWTRTLLTAAHEAVPHGLHSVANYDAAWFLDDHAFTPDQSGTLGDATVVHSWIFDGTGQRYGARSYEVAHRAEYYLELARAFSAPERPLWLQEVGAPRSILAEADVPWFVHETVTHASDCPDLFGITWWCAFDVDRSLADFPDLEYTLGLFDSTGSLKPAGDAFAAAIATTRERWRTNPPRERGTAVTLHVGSEPLLRRSPAAPGGEVFEQWMELSRAGERPSIDVDRTRSAGRSGDARTGGAMTTQEA